MALEQLGYRYKRRRSYLDNHSTMENNVEVTAIESSDEEMEMKMPRWAEDLIDDFVAHHYPPPSPQAAESGSLLGPVDWGAPPTAAHVETIVVSSESEAEEEVIYVSSASSSGESSPVRRPVLRVAPVPRPPPTDSTSDETDTDLSSW